MRSWYRLNIDVSNAVAKDFKLGYPPEPGTPHTGKGIYLLRPDSKTSNRILSQEWKSNLLSTTKARPGAAVIVFVTPLGAVYDYAHVDLDTEGTRAHPYGLNWVDFYDDDRDMVWYQKPEEQTLHQEKSHLGNAYQLTKPTDETVVDRCRIGKQLTLVRTDIPHRIDSPVSRASPFRVAISIRPSIPVIETWEDAVEYFRPFMLND
jgi:hypothetical protein